MDFLGGRGSAETRQLDRRPEKHMPDQQHCAVLEAQGRPQVALPVAFLKVF